MRKTSTTIVALTVLLLAAASTLEADSYQDGIAAFKSGNLQEAARQFQACAEERPDIYQCPYMAGQALLKLGKNQEALAHLRKAHELNESDLGVQMALGTAYLVNGRHRDAVVILGNVNPSSLPGKQKVALHQMLAKAYDKTGDEQRARAELKAAADAAPDNADLHYAYGAAAFNAGDLNGAISALGKAAQLDPGDTNKQKTYAQALMRKGRTSQGSGKLDAYTKAATALRRVVAASPTYDNLIDLAGAQLGAKQYDGALESLGQASGKSGADWLAPFYMGQAYTQKQQYRSAEQKLKEALNKTSKNEDKLTVLNQLGFVYEKTKEYDNAKAAYRQAGNNAAVTRVEENQRTADFNKEVEQEAAEIRRLQEEQEKLKEELKNLPGAKPPVR